MFTVQRKKGIMGYFAPERWGRKNGKRCHEIAINPSYIAQSRLIEIMQTLVHEMVHCWQHCFGNPGRSYYHNKEWAAKMASIGLMPSSTGEPGGETTGQQMGDYILEDHAFHRSFLALCDQKNFEMQWADRRALPRVFEPLIVNERSGLRVSDCSAASTKGGEQLAPKIVQSIGIEENLEVHNPSEPWLDNQPSDFLIPETQPRKTRVRYICPCCEVKVYGKLDLRVRCEDCDTLFICSQAP